MRTAVVLPAPFGPRTPSTVPFGTDRSIPRSARTSPNDLVRPSTRIAGPELICDTQPPERAGSPTGVRAPRNYPHRRRACERISPRGRFDRTNRFGHPPHTTNRSPGTHRSPCPRSSAAADHASTSARACPVARADDPPGRGIRRAPKRSGRRSGRGSARSTVVRSGHDPSPCRHRTGSDTVMIIGVVVVWPVPTSRWLQHRRSCDRGDRR